MSTVEPLGLTPGSADAAERTGVDHATDGGTPDA